MRVIDICQHAGFELERQRVAEPAPQSLYRDGAIEYAVAAAQHKAKTSPTDDVSDIVVGQRATDFLEIDIQLARSPVHELAAGPPRSDTIVTQPRHAGRVGDWTRSRPAALTSNATSIPSSCSRLWRT